ncbi:aminoadipate-semialdehyde dehydrogenase-phosphopantetheinyl transferase [Heterostelium album PN500]|uniref:holo-[acyl-carrier-protein] synthase n=1 Tax=Heterostelium pallidum (strain ATCC 26659 / Pp 5 / PN500) TaxID=670386 RepID=D3BHE8_HETP5|nr:aminoadipate-semialdehyde dehydrogenase-phosphopantetheinyl transferase [Heterostelium album PN500]EFA79125.1 aminoadipate-semialdehyde dehydrogenase-phosphopantetheinyl transferase [Heterostelium album PN500]|eukprot:XP_020431247.1 aminoadipate-semialdehyde dehydrogenase-phosphopantetheinyl transferase [Heterostelium album PN500]
MIKNKLTNKQRYWKPSAPEWATCLNLLNDKVEVDRIQSFKRPTNNGFLVGPNNDSAKASLAGRLLMLLVTHRLTGLDLKSIRFERLSNGKPYLVNKIEHTYLFNVSHDGDYTVIYAVYDCPESLSIGVDTMKSEIPRSQNPNEFFESMKSCFTNREWLSIRDSKQSSDVQTNRFFRHWCLKESFVKAIGVGIELDLQSCEFIINEQDNQVKINIFDDKYFDSYTHFVLLPNLLPNHIVALCHYEEIPIDNQKPNVNHQYEIETLTAQQLIDELTTK